MVTGLFDDFTTRFPSAMLRVARGTEVTEIFILLLYREMPVKQKQLPFWGKR